MKEEKNGGAWTSRGSAIVNRKLQIENMNDFKYAARMWFKRPGFTLAAVLTLALGIGSASAVFGLIHSVLLSPPPYYQPDRLVLLSPARHDGRPYNENCMIGDWLEWRNAGKAFQAPAIYHWTFGFLILPEGSESISGMVVSKDYFKTLGLHPQLGREFSDLEAAGSKSGPTAIMLGYELWQKKFNADPNILGKSVHISRIDTPLSVVGVMPPGVRFLPDPGNASEPNYDINARVDYWLATTPDETHPKNYAGNVVARLRADATLSEAQAEATAISARRARSDHDLDGLTATVHPLPEVLNHEGVRLLMPLMAAVALVFLIACGNVAALLLARGLQRQQEYAVRSALGAGRRRIFRQVLVESIVLSLVGGAFGMVLANGTVNVLKAIGGHAVPRSDSVQVGWPVFVFGFAAALTSAVIAGLLPALRASSQDPFQSLKGARASGGRAEHRLLGGVVTFQIALTFALLAGAALLIQTMNSLAKVRPGYDMENVLTMTVTCVQRDHFAAFHSETLRRVSALPGVKHAAFVWGLPLTGNKWGGEMEIVGQPGSPSLKDKMNLPLRSVTEDYFDALGVKLVDGRGFRPSDGSEALRVAVVNQALAERYFPKAYPLGRKLRFVGDTNQTIEVVGIVSNTRTEELSQSAEPEIYFPFWQSGAFSKHLIVRTVSDPMPLAATIRREIHDLDPTAAVEHFKTMTEIRGESLATRTFATRLLGGFSCVACVLALVGIYGVLSLSVRSRTKEIAVRVAIGAQQHEILRLVLSEGFRLIVVGLAIGVIAAVFLGRVLASFLFGVTPADPLTLAGVAFLFAAAALLACYVPARRATKVDPMVALRYE